MKALIATEKPFAAEALTVIQQVFEKAGIEVSLLEKYTNKEQLLEAVKDVQAIIVRSDIIDSEVFSAAKKLKIVVRAGAGYDNVDLNAATAHNVVVMNTPGQNSNAVAELTLGLIIYAVRNFYDGSSGTELKGKKLGVHAFGNIGRIVARLAKNFGMEVYTYNTSTPNLLKRVEKEGVTLLSSVEELYETCQYISLHVPATEETKNSINFNLLSKMPEKAILINTARKEIINEEELIKLMEERPDFKYLTDITPKNDAEMKEKFAKRYFSTPKKMGAQTAEANNNTGIAAANQIVDFLLNGNTKFKVN